MIKQKFIIPLLMPRRQYDVGNILYENGLLDKLVIDAYYDPKRYPIFYLLDKLLPQRIVDSYRKYKPKVNSDQILSSWIIGLKFRFKLYLNRKKPKYIEQIKASKELNVMVIKYLKKSGATLNVYGIDTASLEVFEYLKRYSPDSTLYLEQCVVPRRQQALMYKRFERENRIADISGFIAHCETLGKRELREWQLADKIFVPSKFVGQCIEEQGISKDKICYLPYGYDSPVQINLVKKNIDKKFLSKQKKKVVLFAGNAGFRKGVHDLFEIANSLDIEDVLFKVAGKIEHDFKAKKPDNVFLLGALTLKQLSVEYQNADVFFFPTYLEGSASVTYEAMSWGLPLLTTVQSGSTARNGQDGFIVDAGDIDVMKEKLFELLNNDNLRYEMALNSLENSKNFTLQKYKVNLLNVITN